MSITLFYGPILTINYDFAYFKFLLQIFHIIFFIHLNPPAYNKTSEADK